MIDIPEISAKLRSVLNDLEHITTIQTQETSIANDDVLREKPLVRK